MASPFTAYLAGMGTLAAVLALGLSTAVMLIEPSPSVQRRAETKTQGPAKRAPADPLLAVNSPVAVSPVITAARTPRISTHFAAPPALWPPPPSTTGQSSDERPALAADPGMLQIPVRPVAPVEAAARETLRDTDGVSSEGKKKDVRNAQRKRRKLSYQARRAHAEGALETRAARGYAQQQRDQAPLGFFGLLFSGQ